MILLLRSPKRISRLGRKVIILLVTFSSAVTLVITAVQLFVDYRVQRDQVETMLERIPVLFPPIANEVWSLDDAQVQLSLESLVRLPDIERASVTALDNGATWNAKSHQSQHQIIRAYPLSYKVRGSVRPIATIEIAAGLDKVYGTLLWQCLTILLSNGFKTFVVVLFLYLVFYRLVTVRLGELTRRVHGLVPRLSDDPRMSPAESSTFEPARGDELDAVRWAFDDMADRLKLLVTDINARNQQLSVENRERQWAEAELQETVRKLSKAMVEVERFAYVAAHDLKEPIRSIVSFSQLIERRHASSLGEEGRQFLGFVISEGLRMSDLVSDLLEYSRCDKQSMAVAPVDCNQILADVQTGLSALIAQTGAEIVSGKLPAIHADPGQVRQLFQNLIANSLKFSRPDVAPRVEIRSEQVGGGWVFSVADNGIGIDPQYGDYIFEVFRRLHTRDTFPGTGIGLAICKRVVENHGGRIWLESGDGGAIFHFTLG